MQAWDQPQLHLYFDIFERDLVFLDRDLEAVIVGNVVVVAPFVYAHFLRQQCHHGRWTITYVFATTQLVDGNGGVVSVGHRPDDVLRTECWPSPPKNNTLTESTAS
jgi:hypothetical protein